MQSSWWWPVIHRCYRCYNITTATGDCRPHVGQLPFHPCAMLYDHCLLFNQNILLFYFNFFHQTSYSIIYEHCIYFVSFCEVNSFSRSYTGFKIHITIHWVKKPCHPTFVHNYGVCWPIFKIFTAGFSKEFVIKLLSCFHHTLYMLLHYLEIVNVQIVSFSGSKLLQKSREKCSRNTQTMMSHLFGILMRKYLPYSRT